MYCEFFTTSMHLANTTDADLMQPASAGVGI